MAYGTLNADLMTTSDGVSSSGLYGFKNRIINGAMMIDQRNAGASINIVGGTFPVDRFVFNTTQDNKGTAQRSTTAPTNFINSLLLTSSSAYSVVASDLFNLESRFEGLNTADLNWGSTAASAGQTAQPITISFWVRSSLTGAFGGAVTNSARNRSYPFSYTINSANTWEQKSVTVAGDTSGTWATDNTRSIILIFSLGAGSTYSGTAGAWTGSAITQPTGSTSLVGTNAATLYITGVQLEKGSTATSFDYRPYGTELQLCQRYYWKFKAATASGGFSMGYAQSGTTADFVFPFPVVMRTNPTALETTGTASDYRIRYLATNATCDAVPTFFVANAENVQVRATVASGLTGGNAVVLSANASGTAYLGFSAEL